MSTRKNPPQRSVRHAVATLMVVSLGTIGTAAPAIAAPVAGCPSGTAGWDLQPIEDVAEAIVGAAEGDFYDYLVEVALAGLDRNGDGDLCLAKRWGEALNPKSYWYRRGMELIGQPLDLFIVIDNVARGR